MRDESFKWQSRKETVKKLSKWERAKEASEENRLLSLFQILQRTCARLRKRYGCWRLICVWRKWRERRGRNHPPGRKKPVEVMAGLSAPVWWLFACPSSHTYMSLSPYRHPSIRKTVKKKKHYRQNCPELTPYSISVLARNAIFISKTNKMVPRVQPVYNKGSFRHFKRLLYPSDVSS